MLFIIFRELPSIYEQPHVLGNVVVKGPRVDKTVHMGGAKDCFNLGPLLVE